MPELLVTDPSSGETVGRLPFSDADEVVVAARAAHPGWERTSPSERAAALEAGARRLRGAIDDIALLQTREGGEPLATHGAGWRPASARSSSTPSWAPSMAAGRSKGPGGRATR